MKRTLSNAISPTLLSVTRKYARWQDNYRAGLLQWAGCQPQRLVRTVRYRGMDQARRSGAGRTPSCLESLPICERPRRIRRRNGKCLPETGCRNPDRGGGIIANTWVPRAGFSTTLNGDQVLLIGAQTAWCTEQLWPQIRRKDRGRPARERKGLLYVVATQNGRS